jgi:hypothetical protein
MCHGFRATPSFPSSFLPDLCAIAFIYHFQLVKSYTVSQKAVENMRMVDDHAYNSPIATHLRAR